MTVCTWKQILMGLEYVLCFVLLYIYSKVFV